MVKFEKLIKSPIAGKKWRVYLSDGDHERHVDFGATGYEDYTQHHDAKRKALYLLRHKSREDWTKSGIYTAGFWSRWLLWNLPSLHASQVNVRERFSL